MEGIISGAFCFLIGAVGLWTGFKQLRNRSALNNWPTTNGKVIEHWVDVDIFSWFTQLGIIPPMG